MALWRTLVRVAAVAGVTVSIGLLPAGPVAQATPSVEEVERQLDEAWEKIEPLIEQYNKVHSQLVANQKKATKLQNKIQPLELQVSLAMARVGELAAAQYKRGPVNELNAVLRTGSPTELGEQLALLDIVARTQNAQIAEMAAARDKYAVEKRKLDQLVATQKKQQADLKARRKAIQADIDKLERLRVEAYGTSTSGGSLRIGPCPAVYVGGSAGVAVKAACAQIGKPYVWGAVGPNSFDCSGLTQYAWKKAGVSLTHYTGAQWDETTAVSRSSARPGDLVFFGSSHVGMYVGNSLMVHAPHTGDVVRMASVDKMGKTPRFRRV